MLPGTLSVTVKVATKLPKVEGEKVTSIVHDVCAARVDGDNGQLLVWGKLLLSVPEMAMFVIVSAEAPLFLNVNCRLSVPPTGWLPNETFPEAPSQAVGT